MDSVDIFFLKNVKFVQLFVDGTFIKLCTEKKGIFNNFFLKL